MIMKNTLINFYNKHCWKQTFKLKNIWLWNIKQKLLKTYKQTF